MRKEADAALTAALEAAAVLRHHFREGVLAEEKAPGDPVSVADRDADAAIAEVLRRAFPEDLVLSEETEDDADRLTRSRVWIVDPLDGTRDFLEGRPEFAVHVGLAVDGVAVVGAVLNPVTGEGALAIKGEGCRRIEGETLSGPLRVREPGEVLEVVVSRSRFGADQQNLLACIAPAHPVRSGSSGCKALLLAYGRADVYLGSTPGMSEWDVCAPQLVIDEAMGRCTDMLGDPIRYNQRDVKVRRGLLATAASCHERILERLRAGYGAIAWLP